MTAAADEDRIQVVRFGTGIFESAEGAVINPGDEIYVAGEVDTPARTDLEVAATIVGITTSIVVITVTILQYMLNASAK